VLDENEEDDGRVKKKGKGGRCVSNVIARGIPVKMPLMTTAGSGG
jgi:hypothetical protein